MKISMLIAGSLLASCCICGVAVAASSSHDSGEAVGDEVIAKQREALAASTKDAGFGPQSPRDIDVKVGENTRSFGMSPTFEKMNLCNIHFHENAEHKGGEFKVFAGNGDGHGYGTGYKYSGKLSEAELAPFEKKVGDSDHGFLEPGDTIEAHYVFSSAKIKPGPTLGACLSEAIKNPQLRVEAQVFVLVNDESAADFRDLAKLVEVNGYHQAVNIPTETGQPVVYTGSTTGPGYNEKGSPFQVTWSVRPKVMKVSISSVDAWLSDNVFDEDHAHGVRNLVENPFLLSSIK